MTLYSPGAPWCRTGVFIFHYSDTVPSMVMKLGEDIIDKLAVTKANH